MNPARQHFALARLAARFAPDAREETRQRHVRPLDRDQSVVENYAVAIWIYATTTAYLLAVTRPIVWPLMALASPLLLQIPLWVVGGLATALGGADNRKLVGSAIIALLLIASSYFATTQSPVRFVAFLFLGVCALNALAALVRA